MSIQKQIIVRHREQGHVRFQLPDPLVRAAVAQKLITEINALEGVYRSKVFRGQKKLSIRYHETVCNFNELAHRLSVILQRLEEQGWFAELEETPPAAPKKRFQYSVNQWRATHWVKDKYEAVRETAQAAKVITKLGMKKPNALIKDPEKAIIDFLNDVLVLYLIKLHWPRITKEWIPRPFTHRYEWLAVFYLFYLLVRSRRPKK